jgi:tetratricopeptide (TPR) repeat protein
VAFAHGDIHERIEVLTKQIAANPQDAQLYVQRAELSRQHADWQAALADCDQAHKLDPAIEMDLLRGRTLLESGRPADALPLLDGFLVRHPGHAQALVYRARTLAKLERHAASIADYREALKRTPTPEPDLVQECADALAARGCVKEAVQVLAAGIDKLGEIPSLVQRAMNLEIATKDFTAALRRVESMRQSAPRPEPWMARRASILAQAGRIEESRAAWQALVDHLSALPNLERGSHAMSTLMEQAKQALTSP